jgi:hypothetical protein
MVYIDEKVVSFLFSLFVGQVRAPPYFGELGGARCTPKSEAPLGRAPTPGACNPTQDASEAVLALSRICRAKSVGKPSSVLAAIWHSVRNAACGQLEAHLGLCPEGAFRTEAS